MFNDDDDSNHDSISFF